MTKQHLRFSVELWSKSGHEALVSQFEGELKHLEHVREYLNKRAKAELDYATTLGRISTAASKFISESDYESPIKKAWGTYITESERKAKLISEFANHLNSTTLRKLEQLIDDKRNLLKKYKNERFKVESCFKQESDEIDRLRKTYQDNAKESETGKRKYEAVQKEKFHTKDWERSKDKYVKTTLKLHQNHNDYVLALTSGNCHRGCFSEILIPKMLNSLQYLQEEYVAEWKDLVQEAIDLTNCCREEFQLSSQELQTSINDVSKEHEYMTFIAKHSQSPAPVYPFMFDPVLLEMTSSGVLIDELVVNDLTLEKLQHKSSLLGKDLENVVLQLEEKEAELEQETDNLQKGKQGKEEKASIIQKEQNIAMLNWHVDQLKCIQTKLQKMCSQIADSLNKLGNSQPPKFADLSAPSLPVQEFGTPETRRSSRKITTLFNKKRKLDKENSHTNIQNACETAGYEAKNENGTFDDLSDDEAVGEYIEPDEEEIPLDDEEWFHGIIDRKEAEKLLRSDGDFLVRESSSKKDQFVLSAQSAGQIRHFIIQNSDDGYVRFEDKGFPSIRQLLEFHIANRVHVTKKSMAILKSAVPRKVIDKWQLSREDIVLDKKLGHGHFGDVMKGFLKPLNSPVAVKSCRENVTEIVKHKFLAEAEILKQYDHPNVVRLIGVCAEKEPVYIVMEFMPGGDFLVYLRKHGGKLTQKRLVKFSIDAAAGMEYLASNNCIHRDLAARNCLVGDGDLLKISDFGMSREVEEVYEASSMKEIPVKWTAPEALNYTTYTTQSDIWSFGVLLWETFSLGNQPYPGFNNKETREKVDSGYRMPAPMGTPQAVYQIMKDCWSNGPNDRPSFSEVLRRLKQIQEVTK